MSELKFNLIVEVEQKKPLMNVILSKLTEGAKSEYFTKTLFKIVKYSIDNPSDKYVKIEYTAEDDEDHECIEMIINLHPSWNKYLEEQSMRSSILSNMEQLLREYINKNYVNSDYSAAFTKENTHWCIALAIW